ncbi:uncharacterized protein SCHCODRAFT_02631126 [Schizophyllum commune H4-8]|uniref:uncharacterized protein n=1 Tax=Schizophyllum commune (strain H4-8 / FGSC 9210) TaxID=578458 RepID=UPI00215F5AAA|nr:uncharacterized protein SCHCODRAFT_02631126 [Schizophyllum commune H4-8]KAI5890200.1 hypothetical protein SCHCODRAFT_02631126 [Schizophyllum commune H4-8]
MGRRRRTLLLLALLFALLVVVVKADDVDSDDDDDDNETYDYQPQEYTTDPYLQYRPAFPRSLPVQILVTGVVFTLVAVLFIHLIFTATYHWSLAPVNYVLQVSGVTTLLISLIATLHVVLQATIDESKQWPYMLSYIAVNVPPLDLSIGNDAAEDTGWTLPERATWLVMNAFTSALIQITHIQFLTLLFPSRLEARLILFLLGPMAVVASVMQLVPISQNTKVTEITSAIRNVCNATLSLLFTASLFIWGLLVNRRQAWRTDGGTAAFGAAALTLAIVQTGLNILYVPREEEYVWLPTLIWAVILWQSFLGWWWWVGAGSGSGLRGEDEEEDMARRERKRAKRERRRQEARVRREDHKARARTMWRGVSGVFGPAQHPRREEDSEEHDRTPEETERAAAESTASSGSTGTLVLPRIFPKSVHRWFARLRRAHTAAARAQAAERLERIREMERAKIVDAERRGFGVGRVPMRTSAAASFEDEDGEPKSSGEDEPKSSGEEDGNGAMDGDARGHPDGQSVREGADGAGDSSSEGRARRRSPHVYEEEEEQRRRRISVSPPTIASVGVGAPDPDPVRRSMWWWGPLGRWRLQDKTVYQ